MVGAHQQQLTDEIVKTVAAIQIEQASAEVLACSNVQSKLLEFVSVKDFGAVGDGSIYLSSAPMAGTTVYLDGVDWSV